MEKEESKNKGKTSDENNRSTVRFYGKKRKRGKRRRKDKRKGKEQKRKTGVKRKEKNIKQKCCEIFFRNEAKGEKI